MSPLLSWLFITAWIALAWALIPDLRALRDTVASTVQAALAARPARRD